MPDKAAAAKAAEHLFRSFPARDTDDHEIRARNMTVLMASFPLPVIRAVLNPRTGIVATSKWLPTQAEVKQALDAELVRFRTRAWLARRHLEERARRAAEHEDNRNRPSEAERAAHAKRAMDAIRKAAANAEF